MSELRDKILINIHKGMENNMLSNDDLVQFIELSGSYLNLMTIPDYAYKNNISYNGGTITNLDGSTAILCKRPTKDIADETYRVHTELVALLKDARDLLLMCTLLDNSGQCHKMVNKIDAQLIGNG